MSAKVRYGALVVLVGAGVSYYFWHKMRQDALPPDSADSVTHWICDKCGTQVELTAQKIDEWGKDGIHVDRSPQASRAMVFKCDKCGTFTLCQARQCPEHKIWFVAVDSSNQIRTCPKCAEKAGR